MRSQIDHIHLLHRTVHFWVAVEDQHGPFLFSGVSQGARQAQPGHGLTSTHANMKQGQTPTSAQVHTQNTLQMQLISCSSPKPTSERCLFLSYPVTALMQQERSPLVSTRLERSRLCVTIPKPAQFWQLPGLISPAGLCLQMEMILEDFQHMVCQTSKLWSYSRILPGPSTWPRRMAEVTGPSFVIFVICFFPPMAPLPLSNQGDVSCLCSQPFILRE